MKDTGFIQLLIDRDYKPKNIGFMKDQHGRRGVSALIYINKKAYAIWFIQKDFPTGIYAIAVTVADACIIHPVLEYIETRDLMKVIEFVDELKIKDLKTVKENFTHPWTELRKRIQKV